jgi:flagellar protein FlaJ
MIRELREYVHELVFVCGGGALFIANYLYLSGEFPTLGPALTILSLIIAATPSGLIFYYKYRIRKELERQFLVFINDLTESIDSGMTLPTALEYCGKRDYSELNPYVNELSSQVNWGIPFKKALRNFSGKIGIKTVRRAVETIIEAYKVGGKISDTLRAISISLLTIEKIKRERTASVRGQMVTTYMIFFVFIFILVSMQVFLLPAITPPADGAGFTLGMESPGISAELFTNSFMYFIVIQGFFSGLVTGKMSEGSVFAGLKHSLIFMIIGLSIFSVTSSMHIDLFAIA